MALPGHHEVLVRARLDPRLVPPPVDGRARPSLGRVTAHLDLRADLNLLGVGRDLELTPEIWGWKGEGHD